MDSYKVLFLSTGNFKLPWYEVIGPMTPMGKSQGWIFIDLFVRDKNNDKKTITCRVKSEGFYIVDAEFRD